MNHSNLQDSFFFAANGFDGFYSEFESNLLNESYDRIYIIKGGPGTGKSSFMRRISDYSKFLRLSTLDIYCSSDPNSLDGTIIESNNKRIAIVDGTAPHAIEPRLPFAPDIIVNSQDGLDGYYVEENKQAIIGLNNEKKYFYDLAYANLRTVGIMRRETFRALREKFDYKGAELLAKKIVEEISASASSKCKRMYKSAFGKEGYITLPAKMSSTRSTVYIGGDGLSEYLLMDIIKKELLGKINRICASPLDINLVECIYTNDTLISVSKDEYEFDASVFNPHKVNTEISEKEKSLIDESIKNFRLTSQHHFELEKIYTAAMDFSIYDKYEQQIKEYIGRMV